MPLNPLKYWKCRIPALFAPFLRESQVSSVRGQECVVLRDESVSPREGSCPVRDSPRTSRKRCGEPGVRLGVPAGEAAPLQVPFRCSRGSGSAGGSAEPPGPCPSCLGHMRGRGCSRPSPMLFLGVALHGINKPAAVIQQSRSQSEPGRQARVGARHELI